MFENIEMIEKFEKKTGQPKGAFMAFTTWSDLKTKMENDMADSSWRTKRYDSSEGLSMEYGSFSEFKDAHDFVCFRAELENGVAAGRTYARGGGRF